MENLFKVIRIYCKFGQEILEPVIQLSMEKREIKYIALFVRSIKKLSSAKKIVDSIFEESSALERNTPFFIILAELVSEFRELDLSNYMDTLNHEIIKTITTVIDPYSPEELKKILCEDPSISGTCILRSIGKILVYSLPESKDPNSQKSWSSIERVFAIIGSVIDHSHSV